jgi:hypothetical protein
MLDEKDLEQIQKMIVDTLSVVMVKTKTKKPRKNTKIKTVRKKRKEPKVVVVEETTMKDKTDLTAVKPTLPRIKKINTVKHEDIATEKGKKGKQCRTESFDTSGNRPNYFLNSIESKLFKNDTKIDKKLNAGLQPTPRRGAVELFEINCKVCGKSCIVSESMIMVDPETQEVSEYTCDECIRR